MATVRTCCRSEVYPMDKGDLLAALATCCENPRCSGCGKCVTPWLQWIHNASRDDIIEQTRIMRIRAAQLHAARVQKLREGR
jgi:hypothetical protein